MFWKCKKNLLDLKIHPYFTGHVSVMLDHLKVIIFTLYCFIQVDLLFSRHVKAIWS